MGTWYPEISTQAWLRKFPGLEAFRMNTCICGQVFQNPKPFISKDLCGVECRCQCGRTNSTIVITNQLRQTRWLALMGENV